MYTVFVWLPHGTIFIKKNGLKHFLQLYSIKQVEKECCKIYVMNAKALSKMLYQNDINSEHNIKSMCRAAVAQWTKAPDSQ